MGIRFILNLYFSVSISHNKMLSFFFLASLNPQIPLFLPIRKQMTSLPVFLSLSSATICPTRSFHPPSDFCNLFGCALTTSSFHILKTFFASTSLVLVLNRSFFITFAFLSLFYLRALALQVLVAIRLFEMFLFFSLADLSIPSSIQHLS